MSWAEAATYALQDIRGVRHQPGTPRQRPRVSTERTNTPDKKFITQQQHAFHARLIVEHNEQLLACVACMAWSPTVLMCSRCSICSCITVAASEQGRACRWCVPHVGDIGENHSEVTGWVED